MDYIPRERGGSVKPRLTPADQLAYARIAALPNGTKVEFQGRPAKFLGMMGYLITLRPKGKKTFYLRAGDPQIAEIEIG